MSVHQLLQAAVGEALRGRAALSELVGGVFDAPPVRAALPHAVIGEPALSDWSTKDQPGREARVQVTLHDGGERPVRLRILTGEVEAAIEALPRELGEGWRIASIAFVRSRTVADGPGRWIAASEYRLRLLRSI